MLIDANTVTDVRTPILIEAVCWDHDSNFSSTPLLAIEEIICTGETHLKKYVKRGESHVLTAYMGRCAGYQLGPDINEIRNALLNNLANLPDVKNENLLAEFAKGRWGLRATLIDARDQVLIRIIEPGDGDDALRRVVEKFVDQLDEFERAGGAY